MTPLRGTIQELAEFNREQEWEDAGVPSQDIQFTRFCGMDARDVHIFRKYTSKRFLIVVRCPKVASRVWHGLLSPKPLAIKQKTGTSGVVITPEGQMRVSDYDLMSVWMHGAGGFRKIFISAARGAARGRWSREATMLVRELNADLVTRVQHGCQDDYNSPLNPGVKPEDHFAAFYDAIAKYLPNPKACAVFYRQSGITWPYGPDGKYLMQG